MPKVVVAGITVGDRLREDMGDIAGLAQSIATYGLFHPIIVAQSDMRLVCGHRRLLAVQRLGWTEIEATLWEDLDDETRREIEREENERRKALTDYERSKTLVTRALEEAPVVAAKIAEKEALISSAVDENSKKLTDGRGRPSRYGTPRDEVAKALGVGKATLVRAEQHVAAVEEFPEIGAETPQATAIREAEHLRALPPAAVEVARPALPDAPTTYPFMAEWPDYRRLEALTHLMRIPESDRAACAALVNQPGVPPADACHIIANLAGMPQERRTHILALSTSADKRDRTLALTEAADRPPMPDPVLFCLEEKVIPEIARLHRLSNGAARDGLALALRQLQQVAATLREEDVSRVKAVR